jgi:hypothetical protein
MPDYNPTEAFVVVPVEPGPNGLSIGLQILQAE